jgi:serine/threonine protein kinase
LNFELDMSDVLLSRYKRIKQLNSGGFGDTYLAQDIALPGHPYCVIKHLQPKDPDPAVIANANHLFEREAECLYRFGEQDRFPRLYAHFEENGQFYLVQEFIDGEELTQELIPGKPLTQEQTIALLQEILEVLVLVHQENVIHRDIKPSNIMRRKRDGKLMLIDFGAVKEIGALAVTAQGQTSLTMPVGTYGYMPSEQAQGKPRLASDVYAVGKIGIQALTGVTPSLLPEDPHTGDIIWRDRARVSDELADVLDKMTHEYYRLRYQNASEALRAVNSLSTHEMRSRSSSSLTHVPTVAVAKNSPQPLTQNYTNHATQQAQPKGGLKLLQLFFWVTLGGLAVGATVGILMLNRPVSSPPPAVSDSPTIEPTPEPSVEEPSPEPTPEITVPSVEIPQPTPEAMPTETPSPEATSEPTPQPTSDNRTAVVFNPPTYVRTEPNITGSILCPVRTVTTINVYEATGGWYETDICGSIGYIHRKSLRFE